VRRSSRSCSGPALAILRHGLYDIDRLINRALVYGLLTALLGVTYAVAVLGLGQLSGGVGADTPSWVVAGATLAVAAFSARLRDEIDLDTLAAELLAGVDQTVEPTTVSLWLRPAPPRP
jgi:hypothetical protein